MFHQTGDYMVFAKILLAVVLVNTASIGLDFEDYFVLNSTVGSVEFVDNSMFSDVNFMVTDLWDEPLSLPGYCSEANKLDFESGSSSNVALALDLGCKGEWLHEGNGCFKCKGMSWGTFRCCDGELKSCDP